MSDLSITKDLSRELARLTKEKEVRPLRLSEAIRIGSKLRPECRNWWAQNNASCAIMAAAEATGFPYRDYGITSTVLVEHFRSVLPLVTSDLIERVANRMDSQGHTREQIADWLEDQGY